MNDILDMSVNLILEEATFKSSKQFLDFATSVICYITDDVLDQNELTKDISKDIFSHYGLRYDVYNFNKEMKLIFPTQIYDSGEFCYVFQFIKEQIKISPSYFINFIEEFSRKMKHNTKYQFEYPERAGKSLLSCLFCLDVFLSKFPFFNPQVLKKLMFTVSAFTSWPDPVGTEAVKVYDKMILESVFPSINQFNYLRKTFPTNDYFNPFLRDEGVDEDREIRLEAMLFSDTSSIV